MTSFNNYFLVFAILNTILHILQYIYNKNEDKNLLQLKRLSMTLLLISTSILLFGIYYIIKTNTSTLTPIVLTYIIIATGVFLAHYILDSDFLFQFSKEFNFLLSALSHTIILLFWWFGFMY